MSVLRRDAAILAQLLDASPSPLIAIDGARVACFASAAAEPLLAPLGIALDAPVPPAIAALLAQAGGPGGRLEVKVGERIFIIEARTLEGEVLHVLLGRDVTARRATEQVVDMMAKFPAEDPNPVLRVARDGRVEYANEPARALLFHQPSVAAGALRVPPGFREAMAEADRTGEAVPLEIEIGEGIYVLTVTPIADADYAYVYGRDVTEERRARRDLLAAKEAAEVASRTKSAFLANMSHELRTPLNAIIGYSELLQEEAADLELHDLLPDLDKIRTAGKHLLALINDILDLSKVEAGKMELAFVDFDVARLVHDTLDTVRPTIEKNANRLDVDLEGPLGRMLGDDTKLRQVLMNLLGNAGKFTEGGVVTVRARVERGAHDDRLRLSVTDTGIGMLPEQVERLFQPFMQADGSTTRKYGGTGLGLAITKRFCELMGGSITVSSEEARGTTFHVTVPMRRPAGLRPSTAPPRGPEQGELVLVIDDDPTVHEILRRHLEPEGYRVLGASSGEEGLALARVERPSVITLDVRMPGQDGWSVLARLKEDPATVDVPVVMLSMVDESRTGIALGATDYLTKPVDRARLLSALGAHARRAGAFVLVVDDDATFRDVMRRTLEREGCRVAEAIHGKDALAQLAGPLPDLVFLDLTMPEMNGFELLREMSRDPRLSAVPVIVVTAMELDREETERLRGDVLRTIQKEEHTREEVAHAVRQIVRRRAPP